MKLLYGVVGEGMGHAIRSRVVLEHLAARGHEVEVMASGRACQFLARVFGGVNEIHGFHIVTDQGRMDVGKTVLANVLSGVTGVPRNIAAYFELIEQFDPQAVISDFESFTYLYAKIHKLPILSIDNMQIINRCEHPAEILTGRQADFQLTKAVVKSKLPFCDHYLITSFFRPRVRKERTTLFPPILRPEILAATTEPGEHLLVYHSGAGFDSLAQALAESGLECRIYGMRRDLAGEQVEGAMRYRPFSEDGFIRDLATARAVVASAGFTLMGEAVYLRKPMLAIPLDNHFEQLLNARYLEREGYGLAVEDPGALRASMANFLAQLERFEENLASYEQDGNRELLAGVDHHLARAEAGFYGGG